MLIILLRNQRSYIIKILEIHIRKTIIKLININFKMKYSILNITLMLKTSR